MTELATLDVPGPTRTLVSEPFWSGVESGQLMLQVCNNCSRWIFYPREICPHCWQTELRWERATGHGEVMSHTVVWRPGHPAWEPAVPYVVGIICLAEGPTMLSLVLSETGIGAQVTFQATRIGKHVLPAFAGVEA